MEVLNDGAYLHNSLRKIQTTYCHVFHIHVSLSLQLGYYLPVEPL